MANRRMVASDIFEDDFYMSLNHMRRLMWIGLIVRCADDQGRLQDNSTLIKSQIFPADNVEIQSIEDAIAHFSDEGKIIRYQAGGKRLIQITNWWKYQTPMWANKSKYPSPENWNDREKYHAAGGKVITEGWDKPGGFRVTNQDSNPPTKSQSIPPTKPLNEGDVKGEVNDDAEDNGEGELGEDIPDGDLAPFEKVFCEETRLPVLSGGPERWFNGLKKIKEAGATPEDFRDAIRELASAPKRYNLTSPDSYYNATLNVIARKNIPKNGSDETLADVFSRMGGEDDSR